MARTAKAKPKDMIRRSDAEWLSLKTEYDILPDSMPLIHRITQAQTNSGIPVDRHHTIKSHSAALRQLRSMKRVADASLSHVPATDTPTLRIVPVGFAGDKERSPVTRTAPVITIQHGDVGIVAHLVPGEYHLIIQ